MLQVNHKSINFYDCRKRYGSDMSIVGGIAAPGNSQVSRLCSHRSDHEIHTPQHRADQVTNNNNIRYY